MAPKSKRKRYAPLDVWFAHGRTRNQLLARFGHAGLLTWVCLIAAAKRGRTQGTFTYVSEEGGWDELGLGHPFTPGFTLDEFFRATGQLKKTRKRRDGQLKHIEITRWEHWNDTYGRQNEAERKSRKRAQKTPDTTRTEPGHAPDTNRTEYEYEYDTEHEHDTDKELKPKAFGLQQLKTITESLKETTPR